MNLYEDASRAGQSRRNEDGSIDVWVSQLLSDGPPAQAIEAKYGLQAVGR